MRRLFAESVGSLRQNSFWLLCARVTAQGSAVLFIALTARRLDISDFGQYAWMSSILLIGNTFTTFGTDTLLIREIARSNRSTALIRQALTLQLLFSLMWWFVSVILGAQVPMLIYSLSLFPLTVISILSAVLRAYERMDLFWALTLINSLAQLIGAICSWNLYTLCVALLIGYSIASLVGLWICKAALKENGLLPLVDPRPLIQPVLPFAFLTLLSVVLQRLGILSVSLLLGNLATGFFSTAARILEGLKLGHYAILGALLPALARGQQNSKQKYRMTLVGLLALSILLAVGTTLIAGPVLVFFFGERYLASVKLLTLLVWTLVPYTVSATISVELVTRGLEATLVRVTALALLIYLLLYLALIPVYKLQGAVFASLTGEMIQAILFIIVRTKSV